MKKDTNISFLKGTIALSLSVIITKILGVAFKVPLSYVLGDEGMGYFNTAYAIYGFFFYTMHVRCTEIGNAAYFRRESGEVSSSDG